MALKLLEPVRIGSLELKNRMVLAPMGVTVGNMTADTVEYFVERAKGGAAMIFCNIKGSATFESVSHSIYFNDETEVLFKDIVARCHSYGCKVAAQIMPGDGRIGGPSTKYRVPICASAVPWMHAPMLKCHELTPEEIAIIEADYRESVKAAIRCGADCIEIHAYGGYLTDQFLTARWNIRTDEYGGSMEHRARFLKELIEICKDEGGADYPVIVKFTPAHYVDGEGYRTMDEGIQLAKYIVSCGADALHVDAGCHDNWYLAMPPAGLQEMTKQMRSAKIIKSVVDVPVMTNGRLGDIDKAEAALGSGVCDVAVIGRGMLADPALANKLAEGRPEDIMPCISCNEGCIGMVYGGKPATCALNPRCGHEHGDKDIPMTEVPKRVVIVGGGVGGCMAALYAKEAGHAPVILEKSGRIGGKLHAACKPWFKADMARLITYLEVQLRKAQIPVHFFTEATADFVASLAPDAIIWAAGAAPKKPDIPGADLPNVYAAEDALLNRCFVGDRVLVVGGGMTGVETALQLDKTGHKVTCAARAFPAKAGFKMNDDLLRDLMAASNVEFLGGTRLQSIAGDAFGCTATLSEGEETFTVDCDNVLLALGSEGLAPFETDVPVQIIGDAMGIGKIIDAVHGAWNAVRNL